MSNTVCLNIRTWASKPDKNTETIILSCPWKGYAAQKAVEYSRKILKARWTRAENIIKKDPYQSYLYARHVIQGRWVEAEKNIASQGQSAYLYAKYVLGGRFETAENKRTFKNSRDIYLYSKYVLKGRWEKMEDRLLNHDESYRYYSSLDDVINYARFVIKGRWQKAEIRISKGWTNQIYNYCKILKPDQLEDFERVLMMQALVEPKNNWESNYAKEYFVRKGTMK